MKAYTTRHGQWTGDIERLASFVAGNGYAATHDVLHSMYADLLAAVAIARQAIDERDAALAEVAKLLRANHSLGGGTR